MSAWQQALAYDGVEAFLLEIEEEEDEEGREQAKSEIRPLVRYSQRFYRAFFPEAFDFAIKGFTFRDKRRVARQMVESESDERAHGETATRQIYLAEYFEDLVDTLHGDVDFGYSVDIDDYVEFHNDVFPGWLDAVADWLDAIGHPDESEEISELSSRYSSVAAI